MSRQMLLRKMLAFLVHIPAQITQVVKETRGKGDAVGLFPEVWACVVPQVRVLHCSSPGWVRGSGRWWDTRSCRVGWDAVGLRGRGVQPHLEPALPLPTAPHPALVN